MDASVSIEQPGPEDGEAIHQLVEACPPLDVNSVYAYFLVARHFADTSRVARMGQQIIGAVTGYRLPRNPSILFVWQVAVHPNHRGQGLARTMLTELVDAARDDGVTMIHTTIGPDNEASKQLFQRTAKALGCSYHYEPFLPVNACGPGHDAEDLMMIGPFTSTPTGVGQGL